MNRRLLVLFLLVFAIAKPPRLAFACPSASTSEPIAPPTERPAGGAGCASCTVESDNAPAPAAGALVAIALLGARRRRR